MKPEEIIERMGIGSLWCRVKSTVQQHVKKNDIQDLTEEEAKIAEEAKQGALEILEDALKKKDKVLMKLPERIVLQGEEQEDLWMERHAILTEDKVKKLIAELKKVNFKKNTSSNICAAYVSLFAQGIGRTIYLCDPFWKTQKYLGKFSQPGILIHEVSHFLGAKDITYKENTFSVGCKGSLIKNNPAHSSALSGEQDWEGALRKAFLNASNIEDEFEITLNHRGSYVDGKYTCCGETKRYSVCESSIPDYFHTCDADELRETVILLKELRRRSRAISPKLRRIHRLVDEMDKCLRDFEMGISVTFAGGAGVILGSLLAPATGGLFALSILMFSTVLLGLTEATRASCKMLTKAAKKEVYAICDEYQRFRDIQRLITLLNGEKCLRDCKTDFYTFLDILILRQSRVHLE